MEYLFFVCHPIDKATKIVVKTFLYAWCVNYDEIPIFIKQSPVFIDQR